MDKVKSEVVLFGAGAIGRAIVLDMKAVGSLPVALADNSLQKQGTLFEGIPVLSPQDCLDRFPSANWVCTVMHSDYRTQILDQMSLMGVSPLEFWDFIPNRDCEIPERAFKTVLSISGDQDTINEMIDQREFRKHRNHKRQCSASDLKDVYWPEFITHLDDEYFVDCGAADGDTVREFQKRWKNYFRITAFEPDRENYQKLAVSCFDNERIHTTLSAVSDFNGRYTFTASGDYSSHLGGDGANIETNVYRLDDFCDNPTYIKMDIEGSELEALWGARRILREHSPVLAIAAYHTPDHIWQIPLLIHALQPEYKLFLRRYLPGRWELIWYAVPPERVKE